MSFLLSLEPQLCRTHLRVDSYLRTNSMSVASSIDLLCPMRCHLPATSSHESVVQQLDMAHVLVFLDYVVKDLKPGAY